MKDDVEQCMADEIIRCVLADVKLTVLKTTEGRLRQIRFSVYGGVFGGVYGGNELPE